jgi:hypothetical protein
VSDVILRTKYDQLALAKSEIGRLNEENKQLKNMLTRVTTNYNSLQMHVLTLMQHRNSHRGLGAPGHEVTHEQTKKTRIHGRGQARAHTDRFAAELFCDHQLSVDPEKDQDGSQLLPRQFISLGTAASPDEPPLRSAGADIRGCDCSASPSNTDAAMPPPVDYCAGKGNAATISSKDVMPLPTFDHHHHHHHHRGGAHERDQRGSSPEDPPPHHVPQGWLPSKVPKFLPAKGPEPVPEAATMRKARVSVRARSEAAMVSREWFWLWLS